MRALILLLAAVLLGACNGSNSSGPSEAPEISNLRADQTRTGSGGSFALTVDVLDRDGDVFGGQCVLNTIIGTVNFAIANLGPGVDPNAKVATVTCGASYTGSGGQIAGQVFVVDRAGHQSNGLGFRLNAEGRAGSGGPLVLGEGF
jgi:hypothetical protein